MNITSEAGAASGKTLLTVTPALTVGNSYKYKVAASPTVPAIGDVCSSGYTNWNGSDEITAENGKTIVLVEVDDSNKAVRIGSAAVVSAS